jgi:hypothetical protein
MIQSIGKFTKMKTKKYNTSGSVSKSNRKIVKIGDTSMSLISLNIFVFAKYIK